MEIPNHKQNFLLGIDTGGTYSDGVLLDDLTRQVFATAEIHTTRPDLTDCNLKVLDDFLPDAPGRIRMVSISTTLATNWNSSNSLMVLRASASAPEPWAARA